MVAKLANLADGLTYVSETDAPFEHVCFPTIKQMSTANVAKAAGIENANLVTETDYEKFFRRLTENKDWFGPIEKEQAKRFRKLKELLEKELSDIKVFRFGKIRIDILILGKNKEGKVEGLRTFSVET
ncbi:MAG TPA: nuclease A inhibitor family protein [Pyrinomonadaceae bacterium]|nr:nuclease A inhibitor family protein [Pyrinomonadaceae bacterium]